MLNIIGVITSRYNYWKLHHLRLRLRCATTSTPSRSEWRQLEDPQRDLSLSKSTKRRLYVSSSRFANRKCSSMISVVLKHLDLKFQKSTKLEWRWQVEKEASPAIATQLTWIAPLHNLRQLQRLNNVSFSFSFYKKKCCMFADLTNWRNQ